MRVSIVSDTVQEFAGVRYYRLGKYFGRVIEKQRHERLHRVVWESYHGPIPKGSHVHHLDGDRANNQPENLALVVPRQHRIIHRDLSQEQGRRNIRHAIAAAPEWHGSAAGRRWHKKHYDETARFLLHQRVEKKCEQCGLAYQGIAHARFCSNNCKSAWRRSQGMDKETRICCLCSSSYSVNRWSKSTVCSRACSGKIGGAKRAGRKRVGRRFV